MKEGNTGLGLTKIEVDIAKLWLDYERTKRWQFTKRANIRFEINKLIEERRLIKSHFGIK